MKLRSVLLASGAAVLLPIGGFALTQAVLHETAMAESPAVVAQDSPRPGSWGKRGWGNKWQEQLGLSADQKAQIQKIRDGEKSASEGLREQMRAAVEKQKSLMAGSASDEQLRQQYKEIQALRQQASDRRFETMLQIRKVLTPEQRAKAAQLMQEHRGHRRRGGGRQAMEMMSNSLEF
ncbi:Spy/CpxP family protein refolding chaperone [Altericista sp. CCNU0014]|uniref:Spy/CpxP family protein refolding chaperone n=1 Tax=Altericista sp. CCNU0014 TaxID=3082949 RepID=UPI00384B2825